MKYALCLLICCQNFCITIINCSCFFVFNVLLIQQMKGCDKQQFSSYDSDSLISRYVGVGTDLIVQTCILCGGSLVMCYVRDFCKKLEMVETYSAHLQLLNHQSNQFTVFDKLSEGIFVF